jgi:alcohol dehydrogenase (cytochrome c)
VLLTAGNLVFEGSMDRYFTAYDKTTGEQLWETRLGDIPNSFPITYEADGRQYVAVITGGGGPYAATWGGMMPDILLPPQQGSEVYVFALPESND